jgi:hypothetical protein
MSERLNLFCSRLQHPWLEYRGSILEGVNLPNASTRSHQMRYQLDELLSLPIVQCFESSNETMKFPTDSNFKLIYFKPSHNSVHSRMIDISGESVHWWKYLVISKFPMVGTPKMSKKPKSPPLVHCGRKILSTR